MALFRKKDQPDRRAEPRRTVNARGVVVAPGVEVGCLIMDMSEAGMRIRLERNLPLPAEVVVVDVAEGAAHEARVLRREGHEAGLKRLAQTPLKGLTPSRLTAARDAWIRAGGR